MVISILLEELLELAAGERSTIIGHSELCAHAWQTLHETWQWHWQRLLRIRSLPQAIRMAHLPPRGTFSPKMDLHSQCGVVPRGGLATPMDGVKWLLVFLILLTISACLNLVLYA